MVLTRYRSSSGYGPSGARSLNASLGLGYLVVIVYLKQS